MARDGLLSGQALAMDRSARLVHRPVPRSACRIDALALHFGARRILILGAILSH